MDKSNLVGIVSCVAVFVSFLLALFLLTVKTKNKLSNVLFASFIILSGIDLSGFFVVYFVEDQLGIEMFREQTSFLIMPFFYLYVLSVCYTDFKLRPKHLLHVLPFIIANLVVTPGVYLANQAGKELFFNHYMDRPETLFLRVFIDTQFVFYIVAILLALSKFKKIYLENYTDPSNITYRWLFQLTMVSVVAHSFVMIKNILVYKNLTTISIWANLLVGVIALSVLCWFVLKALYHPELFRGVDSKLRLVKDILPAIDQTSIEKTEVENEVEHKVTELKTFMSKNEPYLEPSLTIQDLANLINMPVRELSILINHHLDQHFFDFVNEYRIKKAMEMLRDPAKSKLTVQEILYYIGFNSKSSFNTAFKKYTDLTPTQYRNGS
ncbi:AraC family transcriptional regulator [Pedobacter sp. Hv1]|uniref:helix-turn-helix domain-containing protein n=1 Tax=Pedobacter sp. Hv1 TaxID=1740090 RepID=UPI0006D8CB3B|nr:AraC family transcriptional regulator [Pedobacter sp. Hv1]KQC00019.1 histidine kinase [Pedobacter sp. Hv1]